jgi:hypothetical protein
MLKIRNALEKVVETWILMKCKKKKEWLEKMEREGKLT